MLRDSGGRFASRRFESIEVKWVEVGEAELIFTIEQSVSKQMIGKQAGFEPG